MSVMRAATIAVSIPRATLYAPLVQQFSALEEEDAALV
jgi:hypothetical protein